MENQPGQLHENSQDKSGDFEQSPAYSPLQPEDANIAAKDSSGSELSEAEVDALIDQLPEVKQAVADINGIRKAGDRAAERRKVEDISALRAQARSNLFAHNLSHTGDEEKRMQLENLANSVSSDMSGQEIMHRLGMLDADGRYVFPQHLYSDRTRQWFDDYMALVGRWEQAKNLSLADGVEASELQYLDRARRIAHDRAAETLVEDTDGTISFLDARELIDKFRERRMPGTGEMRIHPQAALKALQKAADRVYQHENREQGNASAA